MVLEGRTDNTDCQLTVNLERKALQDVILPNGLTIPRGTNVAVDSSMMWDPAIYPDPFSYDIRIPEGTTPKIVEMGFEMLSDPDAKLEVRKRNVL